mmetsp:Transcript_28744/g.66742  ORF Transcript_28744/g.66742 Transcript_28744/m.66742 type:complete len:571 (-) Transcript_28744:39-1751(-)
MLGIPGGHGAFCGSHVLPKEKRPGVKLAHSMPDLHHLRSPERLRKLPGATGEPVHGAPRCYGVPPRMEERKNDILLQRKRRAVQEVDTLDFHGCGGDVEGLRALLAHRFGSSARGWKMAFAPDEAGCGKLGFNGFCVALRQLGYSGRAHTLWKALNSRTGKGSIGLEDIEPELGAMLDACAGGLAERFRGGTLEAWERMHRRQRTRATFEEFEKFFHEKAVIADEHLHEVSLWHVFEALDSDARQYLTAKDFRMLDYWAERRLGIPVPEETELEPFEFEPFSPRSRRPPQQPEQTLEGLCKQMQVQYGSIARAWRVALDIKAHGALTPSQFSLACRAAKLPQPSNKICRELKGAGGGMITLAALDPQLIQATKAFKATLFRKGYASTFDFWQSKLSTTASDAVSRSQFASTASTELGVPVADAKKIFDAVDTAGSGWLHQQELGILEVDNCFGPPAAGMRSKAETHAHHELWEMQKSTFTTLTSERLTATRLKRRWMNVAAPKAHYLGPGGDSLRKSLSQTWSNMSSYSGNTRMHEFYREGVKHLAQREAARREEMLALALEQGEEEETS